MKYPQSTAPMAGLMLILSSVTLQADPTEDKAVEAVVKWGGRITRELAEGNSVVGVDLGANQNVTDAGLKELKHLKSLRTLNLWNG